MSRDDTTRSPVRHVSTPWLQVEERYRDDGTLRLRLEGELDLASGELVRERLRQLQQAGTPTFLDISGITFIDCSGLRVILEVLDAAGRDGAKFELSTDYPAPLRRLLELVTAPKGSAASAPGRAGCPRETPPPGHS